MPLELTIPIPLNRVKLGLAGSVNLKPDQDFGDLLLINVAEIHLTTSDIGPFH